LSRSRTLAAVIAAATLIVAAPAGASARPPAPKAHAAGGDAPPIIPSLISTRTKRVDNALGRLTDYVDDNDTAGVDRTGKVIRRQLAAAWRGAVYYIKNPPPPVADDAVADDDGPLVADQYTSAFAVMESYHAVAATIGQLVDGARVPILDSMSKTLFWTLDARDKAVSTVHSLEPPVDPEAEGGEDAVTFGTVMPGMLAHLDDENQQIKGLQADATDLRPGGRSLLRLALAQNALTAQTVNTYWPPVTED
jgi:hypothetical protein